MGYSLGCKFLVLLAKQRGPGAKPELCDEESLRSAFEKAFEKGEVIDLDPVRALVKEETEKSASSEGLAKAV